MRVPYANMLLHPRPDSMSLHVAMDGEANGVVGQYGVPAADTLPGVWAASDAPSGRLSPLTEFSSPKINKTPLWINQMVSSVQKRGIESKRRMGTVHGSSNSLPNATSELSIE